MTTNLLCLDSTERLSAHRHVQSGGMQSFVSEQFLRGIKRQYIDMHTVAWHAALENIFDFLITFNGSFQFLPHQSFKLVARYQIEVIYIFFSFIGGCVWLLFHQTLIYFPFQNTFQQISDDNNNKLTFITDVILEDVCIITPANVCLCVSVRFCLPCSCSNF